MIPIYTGIENGKGQKIGEMKVELADPAVTDNVILLNIRSQVEDIETQFELPRYHPSSDWLEIFGLPPFNEFSGIPEFEDMDKEFQDPESNFSESFQVSKDGIHGVKMNLKRSLNGLMENYSIQEMLVPSDNRSLGIFDVSHSNGNMKILIERDIVHTRSDIHHLEESKLEKAEKGYLEEITREEGLPDIVILKNCLFDGEAPAIYYEKLFPFWEKENYSKETVRVIEIGYLDYGSNENDLDDVHGRWYKLFNFEDFDYSYLEVREGNWESTQVKINGEEYNTLKSYEKYLYTY